MKIEVGERRGEMGGAVNLASTSITLGKADEARQLADRGLEISRGLGDHAQSLALECVGKCAEAAGDEAEATRLYREAVAMARTAGEPQRLAEALAALGGVLPRAEAAEHLKEAAALGSADTQIAALALLGDAPATRAALEEQSGRISLETRMEALFRIGEVEEAHRLLMHLRDHAPEDCRESILENVPLHREIVAAFNAR